MLAGFVVSLSVASTSACSKSNDMQSDAKACDPASCPTPKNTCTMATCTSAGQCSTKPVPGCAVEAAPNPCPNDACAPNPAQNVLTQHNDITRTGAQSAETILTPANVNADHFGLAFTIPVDEAVYGQPLYVSGLSVAGQLHDVLYVATMNDTAYAFDAITGTKLWDTSLLGPGMAALPGPISIPGLRMCNNIPGHLGVLATPVIDLDAGPHGTMFVFDETANGGGVDAGGELDFYLHALDITTGAELAGSPVDLNALKVSVPGSGVGSVGGNVAFFPLHHYSRMGLLLANGQVYVGFGSLCDQSTWHGWMLGFNEKTLALQSVLNTTPDGQKGGIWQSGDAPAVDSAGNIYVATANGDFTANTGGQDYGDSILKLSPSLKVLDYFTPDDQETLAENDYDLGSAGVSFIPGTTTLFQAGKSGVLRLLDSSNLGHYDPDADTQIIQEIFPPNPEDVHVHNSAPIIWNLPAGAMIYTQAMLDYVRQYKLVGGMLQPVDMSTNKATSRGAALSLSSNGTTPGTGILWQQSRVEEVVTTGMLQAYDATNVSNLLWSSVTKSSDAYGDWQGYTKPTIANGRVYVATASNQIAVYANH
jgi:hypothetical protein